MGTHPSGPAVPLTDTGDLMGPGFAELLEHNPSLLGDQVKGPQLPFLLKILSVSKALSIQAHPDRTLASRLYSDDPDHYPDPNHKPEMTIALTPFRALCGFRPLPEIVKAIQTYPELAELLHADQINALEKASTMQDKDSEEARSALQAIFSRVMRADPAQVADLLDTMVSRIQSKDDSTNLDRLILLLNEQYPGDIGCFAALFLNDILLQPGESLFLAANEPHAYITGDCVECMAASDNVVRAGLTPKFRDVDTLVSMLTYRVEPPLAHYLRPRPYSDVPYTKLYEAPVPECRVLDTTIPDGSTVSFPHLSTPSVAICTRGPMTVEWKRVTDHQSGTLSLVDGSVLFIGANVSIRMSPSKDKDHHPVTLYRAYCGDDVIEMNNH